MMDQLIKPVIGITCGDLNGVDTGLIIKTFSDSRMLEQCIPVIFSSSMLINFYRKASGKLILVIKAPKNCIGSKNFKT